MTSGLRRLIADEKIAGYFGAVKFRLGVFMSLIFILTLVFLLIWQTLENSYQQTVDSVEQGLKTALNATLTQTERWVHSQKKYLFETGHNRKLIQLTKQLLAVKPDAGALAKSNELAMMRRFFDDREDEFGKFGFFIINAERISIGSRRDSNLGVINLIEKQHPELLKLVFDGEAVFIPPIESDVVLENENHLADKQKNLTMFFAAPIVGENGKVLAVLTQRLRIEGMISLIMWDGQIGHSGESYIIDKFGRLVSNSRFTDSLIEMGLLDSSKVVKAFLLRNPGGNLLEGYSPTAPRSALPLTFVAKSVVNAAQTPENKGHIDEYNHIIRSDFSGHRDYRGVPVFTVWLWDEFLQMGMASEIDVAEALNSYYILRRNLLIISVLALLLAGAVTIFLLFLARRAHMLQLSQDELEGLVEDSTNRLIETEAHNQLLLESIGEGIYGLDGNGKIIFVNPSACKMLGYSHDELKGHAMHTRTHHFYPDGSNHLRENCPIYLTFTAGAKHEIGEEVFWCKDGSSFPVEYVSSPLLKGGVVVGAVVTFRDVSERKKTEHALIDARDEADNANRAKSEFLSSMSHELRTPMNAILGFGQLLKMDADGFTSVQRDNVKEILDAGHHLLSLINDVLDLAKIESGKLEVFLEDVPVDKLLHQCISLITNQAEARGLKIIDHISCKGYIVKADFIRLKQVLLNLLSNAIKYNHEQGSITLDCEIINNQRACIRVTDSGDGLTKKEIAKLFNAFERLNALNNIEGTGIGLVITKHLVELMGGSIGVESTPGKGSTFWIEVELAETISNNSLIT